MWCKVSWNTPSKKIIKVNAYLTLTYTVLKQTSEEPLQYQQIRYQLLLNPRGVTESLKVEMRQMCKEEGSNVSSFTYV